MKLGLLCVGRPRGVLADAIAQYEQRISHYFPFQATEVKESSRKSSPVSQVIEEEGERLLARVSKQHELVALHRPGSSWSSEKLADYLAVSGVESLAGVTFVIGGAYGISRAILERADHQLSLSSMTLPHELARLLLVEQIYRAGTIIRGEPYHKLPLE